MLTNTFIHLRGIGRKTELALWGKGIRSWRDYGARYSRAQLSLLKEIAEPSDPISLSYEALERGDAGFFAALLPISEHYRIAMSFPQDTAFLDIETTGLSLFYDQITLIGVDLNGKYYCWVRGDPDSEILDIISRAKCVVTFNGSIFDLRFLRKEFPHIQLPKAHVDLRFLGRSVGLSGAQKAVERAIEVQRDSAIRDMLGEKAPTLWHEYMMGDLGALRTLIQYNYADVQGMKYILDECIQRVLFTKLSKAHFVTAKRFSHKRSVLRFAKRANSARTRAGIEIKPYSGRLGPSITYPELLKIIGLSIRVVGIDLTGSENRPTGWCLLDGRTAQTRRIGPDRDILAETIAAAPLLVSIDSPLSLPRGRLSVGDDDPGRAKFGILRQCERILMQRGVRVYPSLIRSMQRMTARGIELAAQLRTMGIPVIESFPGAAQDILGIPRKREGLMFLRKGLLDFGIEGHFADNVVSHDELDAITSAIVGLFFWAGKFEALGNEDEDYLIIPDLRCEEYWSNREVIGISGAIASGKTTAAEYLKTKGFAYGRFSQALEKILREQGRNPDRRALQELGDAIHGRPGGQRSLGKQLSAELSSEDHIVIDGLRFPEDHSFFVERYGPTFRHLHIEAATTLRLERYLREGHTEADFRVANQHQVEQGVSALRHLADVTLCNEGRVEELARRLDVELRAAPTFSENVRTWQ